MHCCSSYHMYFTPALLDQTPAPHGMTSAPTVCTCVARNYSLLPYFLAVILAVAIGTYDARFPADCVLCLIKSHFIKRKHLPLQKTSTATIYDYKNVLVHTTWYFSPSIYTAQHSAKFRNTLRKLLLYLLNISTLSTAVTPRTS